MQKALSFKDCFDHVKYASFENGELVTSDIPAAQILEQILDEKVMAARIRSRLGVKFDRQYAYDSEMAQVTVTLCHPVEKKVISLAEDTGGVSPAEIPSVTFDDVYGLERAKARLKEAVLFLKEPQKLQAFGIKPPTGILLAGPSGTGKTHLARAVANAAGCVFYALSAGELESKYVGEGEERIRKLFAAARKYAPSIIFIDEIDAIAGNRASVSSGGGGRVAVKMLNQLLVCMDGFAAAPAPILVLAATNRPEALDPAILRPGRFDETVRIEAPQAKAREEMFARRLAKLPVASEIMQALPRLICRTGGMSPAELDRIVREACYTAGKENRKEITLKDLEDACQLVRFGGTRTDLQVSEEERRRVAWHEAGHAVARTILFPGDSVDYLTIIPSESGALGFMAWNPNEKNLTTSLDRVKKQIQVCLAGREGEMMCPGAGAEALNTGAASDLERATALAWKAVAYYGFCEEFGPFSLAGVDDLARSQFAEDIRRRAGVLLAECQGAVRNLLREREKGLERLATQLAELQAMDGDAVERVLQES